VTLDIDKIRQDFPGLRREVHGHRIAFLDSGASSQTPVQVLAAMDEAYNTHYANVHRGVYTTAQEMSDQYEASRTKVARFINAKSDREIVFTRNATESINLVARAWGDANISSGDKIVLSHLEHHSNIVPWQQLAERVGATIEWIPLDEQARFDLTNIESIVAGAKIVAITAASNVTGTKVNVPEVVKHARNAGALVLVDACQHVPHLGCDVQGWNADFVAFSGHKMLGPTGIGVLWAREEILEATPPFLGGGSMIDDVRLDGFTPAALPAKFEAGTPAFIEAVGLAAAIDYLEAIGFAAIDEHEEKLTQYALDMFEQRFEGHITVHGPRNAKERLGVLGFSVADVHPHDVSQLLDEYGVCVRAGHHCAKPLMRVLRHGDEIGIGATSRASLYLYNDESDIDQLGDALDKCLSFFGVR
jgi:cysteine desulfurase/selenocysteine lyase